MDVMQNSPLIISHGSEKRMVFICNHCGTLFSKSRDDVHDFAFFSFKFRSGMNFKLWCRRGVFAKPAVVKETVFAIFPKRKPCNPALIVNFPTATSSGF